MKPNELIRKARIEVGIDKSIIAKSCGLSNQEYEDVESYQDEIYSVVPIKIVACICKALNTNLVALFGLSENYEEIPIDFVKEKMEEKEITTDRLSDLVGIDQESIKDVATNIYKIQSWVMDPILDLAKSLDIDPSSILRKIEEKA